jgi:hypothetical protein
LEKLSKIVDSINSNFDAWTYSRFVR